MVAAQISKVAYRLKLPPHWKIHDIFHASLLTAYKETNIHGPNFIEPPPDIIEGEPEWEVVSRPTTVLWAAGSDDNVFVVEVTDPKEDLR